MDEGACFKKESVLSSHANGCRRVTNCRSAHWELSRGRSVADTLSFQADSISLSYHNGSVFLYGDSLAILSVQYQCIHMYQIRPGGKLVKIREVCTVVSAVAVSLDRSCSRRGRLSRKIHTRGRHSADSQVGPHCYEDDSLQIRTVDPRAMPIASLKHRLLAYLGRRASMSSLVHAWPGARDTAVVSWLRDTT